MRNACARLRVCVDHASGGCGIRTHGDPEATTAFEAAPFVRSGNPPKATLALRDLRRIRLPFPSMRHMGPHNMLGTDPASVRNAHVDRHLVRRVWRFARPYRIMLIAFLVTIVLEALIGIIPPLLIKRIIDTAIPQKDNSMVTTLALLMVAI